MNVERLDRMLDPMVVGVDRLLGLVFQISRLPDATLKRHRLLARGSSTRAAPGTTATA